MTTFEHISFENIVERRRTLRTMAGVEFQKLRHDLTSSTTRAWFWACRGWVHRGPGPDERADGVLAAIFPETAQGEWGAYNRMAGAVARAHLDCARLAIAASRATPQAGLSTSVTSGAGATPPDEEVLAHAFSALAHMLSATSMSPNVDAMAQKLTGSETAADLVPELGTASYRSDAAAITIAALDLAEKHALALGDLDDEVRQHTANLKDLTHELLSPLSRAGRPRSRPAAVRRETIGLLIDPWDDSRAGETATLVVERIEPGSGIAYPSPAMAFTLRDATFRKSEDTGRAMATTVGAAGHQRNAARTADVRWSLNFRDSPRPPEILKGSSMDGAFAMAFMQVLSSD